jgi:hypothetical protein
MSSIEETVKQFCDLLDKTGSRLPECKGETKYKVYFCSGGPGAIPMLTMAAQMFPDLSDKLMQHACKIGQIIWEKGLIVKGNGLCHGIVGNGYMLHTLFRTFDLLAKNSDDRKEKRYFTLLAI